ncbi:MAG: hypothetical protein AABW89_02515 [Nanoarchaeota archaeon]
MIPLNVVHLARRIIPSEWRTNINKLSSYEDKSSLSEHFLMRYLEYEYEHLLNRTIKYKLLIKNFNSVKNRLEIMPSKIKMLRMKFSIGSFNHTNRLLNNIKGEISCLA